MKYLHLLFVLFELNYCSGAHTEPVCTPIQCLPDEYFDSELCECHLRPDATDD